MLYQSLQRRIVACESETRGYRPAKRIAVLIGAYCALLLAACYLTERAGIAITICPLKTFTGLPCPACGSTRAALALLEGNLHAAVLLNPLAVCLYLLAPVVGGFYLMKAKGAAREAVPASARRKPKSARILLWAFAAAAIGANWVYLLLAGR